ncbi:alpha-2 adrenergic receptor [Trichonephila clavipes]|nr:alpha-2 adrenergic receptor [Trichonephila clavipes]
MKIGNNGNLVLGPFDESTPCLMIVLMYCQTKLRINHLTAVKSVAILETIIAPAPTAAVDCKPIHPLQVKPSSPATPGHPRTIASGGIFNPGLLRDGAIRTLFHDGRKLQQQLKRRHQEEHSTPLLNSFQIGTYASSQVGPPGNEVADDLAKAAASNHVDLEKHMVLTSTENYFRNE